MTKQSIRSLPHGDLFKWGFYYGLIMGLVAFAGWYVTLLMPEKSLSRSLVSMAVYLVEFFLVYWAVKKYKLFHKEFTFLHGLVLSLYIGLISGLILAGNILLYYYVINPPALEAWFRDRQAALEKDLADDPVQVTKIMDFTRSFYTYLILFGSIAGQLFIGLLSGLSSSFILKDQEIKA
ncbi:MAG: DUF4199 domain-containing protein [Chlorobi bacterium]|nr:DUF4199 domain-containing protein [Chlorobiota bacterium]